METLGFLTEDQVRAIRAEFGSPVFVYDQATLERQARAALAFPNAFGLTVRYAMKALSTRAILRVLHNAGLHIDASSAFEVERAMRAGIPANHIQLTAQQPADNLSALLDQGVLFTACSLHQLRQYAQCRPDSEVCIRVNPGLGTGHSNRTNVGGPASSFGIWHEHLDEAIRLAAEHGVRITRMHTHIGSGGDPEVWAHCAGLSLNIAVRLPEVHTLSLGGGFKVGRMQGEPSADLNVVGNSVTKAFRAFAEQYGRKLHLEIEPGTFMVANAGALLCTVVDMVDTGADGYRFLKVDSGMTDVLRPSIYGAQHPLVVVPAKDEPRSTAEYVVAGHCCESGDILTPAPDDPEGLLPRRLTEAKIGDLLVVGGAGAYCASMASKNYNSFPESAEILLTDTGEFRIIRTRQTLDHMLSNEMTD